MKAGTKNFIKYILSLAGTVLLGWTFFKVDSPPAKNSARSPSSSPQSPASNNIKHDNFQTPLKMGSATANSVGDLGLELRDLKKCYIEDCGSEKTDARTSYFNVGQKIRQKLLQVQALVETEDVAEPNISEMAREFIENSDGHVQEAAMDLMSTQKPSHQNLLAILEYVLKGNDAELIPQALLELRRYPSEEDQELIRQTLAQVLLTGAPFVAKAVAEKSDLFINDKNIKFFESVTQQIDPKSLVAISLQSSLREFRRKSSAG